MQTFEARPPFVAEFLIKDAFVDISNQVHKVVLDCLVVRTINKGDPDYPIQSFLVNNGESKYKSPSIKIELTFDPSESEESICSINTLNSLSVTGIAFSPFYLEKVIQSNGIINYSELCNIGEHKEFSDAVKHTKEVRFYAQIFSSNRIAHSTLIIKNNEQQPTRNS